MRSGVLMRARLVALALGVGLASSGCGTTGVAAPALESSIAGTFAGLYVLQQSDLGHEAPSRPSLASRASCQKGTPESAQSGAGDWVCRVTFLVAGPATPVVATYDVSLQTNGCWSADGDGPASVNGSRTLTAVGLRTRLNPLKLIDGCLDPG